MSANMLVCSSERLELRRLVDTDAAFILELLNDPDFIRNIADRGVKTLEAAREYIQTGPAASYARFGFGLFLVQLQDRAIPIGICGLLRRDSHPDVEIGFAYLPAFRGRGYAREAAAAVLKFGAQSLRLDRIVALTAPDNQASIQVLEKLGFKLQGMLHLKEFTRPSRLFALRLPPSHRSSATPESA
jgi:[ribosomal protein S5]-alanine N-acetyltransferase